ncbi:MAG: Gfo/Idh/MocA family oxidoreductase [Clostridia bacterium]|nr:Gfo/Idh/MocA family oxidoreductase [Oscillospiraceae bacterium]MBR4893133.1 Gfo/Idh/MocA family oxidoreductase [Clostridia bacterium]
MFRVGILGSDNSHAQHFATLCNVEKAYGDDVRIECIYGRDDDPAHTKEVAEIGKIPYIAKDPKEFLGKVDAVMVVYRRGALHVPEILPFIEAGLPVWLDKPVCESLEDIEILREAVERNNTLITGGSTLKYNYEILTLKDKVESGRLGAVSGGCINFPGDLESEYGGIFFYGSHLIEMMLSVFGYDVKSVTAKTVAPKNSLVIVKYEDRMVSLAFNNLCPSFHITVYGLDKACNVEVDISFIYRLGFAKFVEMLKTKKMPLSFDDLVKPVYVLNAIKKSLDEDREVELCELIK